MGSTSNSSTWLFTGVHLKQSDVICRMLIAECDYIILGQQKNVYRQLFCDHGHKKRSIVHFE